MENCTPLGQTTPDGRDKKFCAWCGGSLDHRFAEGLCRRVCEDCGQITYENPIPASAVVLVDERERILLVRRSVEPKVGMWCLPGGFMELGEEAEECALRELSEETGITGKIEELLGLTISDSKQYHTVLLMGYLVRQYSGEPVAGDDASEVGFFSRQDLPELAFSSHQRFVRIYFAGYQPAEHAAG